MNIPVLVDLTSADVTKPIENMADRLSAAGQTVVLGMCAVFAVLAILWLVLAIMGKFFTAPAPKKAEEKKEAPVQTEPLLQSLQRSEDSLPGISSKR